MFLEFIWSPRMEAEEWQLKNWMLDSWGALGECLLKVKKSEDFLDGNNWMETMDGNNWRPQNGGWKIRSQIMESICGGYLMEVEVWCLQVETLSRCCPEGPEMEDKGWWLKNQMPFFCMWRNGSWTMTVEKLETEEWKPQEGWHFFGNHLLEAWPQKPKNSWRTEIIFWSLFLDAVFIG